MTVKTRNPNKKNKVNQGVVIQSNNGLPIDSYLTLEGTRPLFKSDSEVLSYSDPTVTVPNSVDLEEIRLSDSKYTGKLVLITPDKALYFIDRLSMDNVASTFDIYNDIEFTESPNSIDLSLGWVIAEAKLVNKLATTSTAHIDEVEFNGFDVSFNLDGSSDSVSIVDGNNQLEINPDGSINVKGEIDLVVDADDGDTIAVSRHSNPFELTGSNAFTAAQLDVSTPTQIFTHTNAALQDLRIKVVKADANTFGLYIVKVNGQVRDKFRTSPTERNCNIVFSQEIDLPISQTLTVEFQPDRLRISDYDTFVRLEGYQNI